MVLVNLRSNRIYELNRTASRVWELIEPGCDREGLERAMLEEFEVPETQLSRELDLVLSRFSREGLTNGPGDGG
jgi:Coenzyme PQQ synthesis protein D (PqqD)